MEKVIYFLLLDRKRRKPADEDEEDPETGSSNSLVPGQADAKLVRSRSESGKSGTQRRATSANTDPTSTPNLAADPPRKRVDQRRYDDSTVNGKDGSPRIYSQLTLGSPVFGKRRGVSFQTLDSGSLTVAPELR